MRRAGLCPADPPPGQKSFGALWSRPHVPLREGFFPHGVFGVDFMLLAVLMFLWLLDFSDSSVAVLRFNVRR